MADKPEILTTTEARAGASNKGVRYVLIISVILAVGAMVWTYAAAPKGDQQGATTMTTQDGATTQTNAK